MGLPSKNPEFQHKTLNISNEKGNDGAWAFSE